MVTSDRGGAWRLGAQITFHRGLGAGGAGRGRTGGLPRWTDHHAGSSPRTDRELRPALWNPGPCHMPGEVLAPQPLEFEASGGSRTSLGGFQIPGASEPTPPRAWVLEAWVCPANPAWELGVHASREARGAGAGLPQGPRGADSGPRADEDSPLQGEGPAIPPRQLGKGRRPCPVPLLAWPGCLGNLRRPLSPEPAGGLETTGSGQGESCQFPACPRRPRQGLWVTGLFSDNGGRWQSRGVRPPANGWCTNPHTRLGPRDPGRGGAARVPGNVQKRCRAAPEAEGARAREALKKASLQEQRAKPCPAGG